MCAPSVTRADLPASFETLTGPIRPSNPRCARFDPLDLSESHPYPPQPAKQVPPSKRLRSQAPSNLLATAQTSNTLPARPLTARQRKPSDGGSAPPHNDPAPETNRVGRHSGTRWRSPRHSRRRTRQVNTFRCSAAESEQGTPPVQDQPLRFEMRARLRVDQSRCHLRRPCPAARIAARRSQVGAAGCLSRGRPSRRRCACGLPVANRRSYGCYGYSGARSVLREVRDVAGRDSYGRLKVG